MYFITREIKNKLCCIILYNQDSAAESCKLVMTTALDIYHLFVSWWDFTLADPTHIWSDDHLGPHHIIPAWDETAACAAPYTFHDKLVTTPLFFTALPATPGNQVYLVDYEVLVGNVCNLPCRPVFHIIVKVLKTWMRNMTSFVSF